MQSSVRPLVSVCIATYKRPQLLRELISSLLEQKLPETFSLEIVVVDNDPDQTGGPIVREFSGLPDRVISYFSEPESNLSTVRNTCVREAKGDLIAFIDDDEVADPNWLRQLVSTMRIHNADAVAGPVIPVYPISTPDWITKGGFFDRPSRPSGTVLSYAATNNLLIGAGWFKDKKGVSFDPEFGKTGGEDTSLLYRLTYSMGAKLVWCNEAIVREIVPTDRSNARYLIKRAYRKGQIYASVVLPTYTMRQRIGWFTYRLLISLSLMGALPIGWAAGRITGMRIALKVASNLGQLTALVPFRINGY